MKKLKAASMFAGIGGICLGFQQAGFDIVWANENDFAACKTYRYNFGDEWLHDGDIREIMTDTVPDIDVLTAGFPCQPFSIAGKQKGFCDPRGNLFFEIARIIAAKCPSVIFLENVGNLLEHDNGRSFLVVHDTLVQFGYIIKYRLMDASIYGNLPQPRNRIYIMAFLDSSLCNAYRFPDPIDLTVHINDIIDRNKKMPDIYYYHPDSEVSQKYGREITDRGYIYRISDNGLVRVRRHFCPTLTANMGTYPNRVPLIRDDFGIRKLTLRECLAFQGFPSDFYFPNSITINDAYKQIGNSVCVPVIRRIAEHLRTAFKECDSKRQII